MPRAGGGGGSYAGLVLEVVAGSGAGYTGKILEYSDADHAVQVAPPVPGGAGALDPTSRLRVVLNLVSHAVGVGSSHQAVQLGAGVFRARDDYYAGMALHIRRGPGAPYTGIIRAYDAATRTCTALDPPHLPAAPSDATLVEILPAAPFTSRAHLAGCDAPNDVGCGADGVEWVRTLGRAALPPGSGGVEPRSWATALAASSDRVFAAGAISGFDGGAGRRQAFLVDGADAWGLETAAGEARALVAAFRGG